MNIQPIHEQLKSELETELSAFDTLRDETFDEAKKLEAEARKLRQSVKAPDLGRISTQCTEAYSKTLADIKQALNDWALSADGGLSPRCQTLAMQAMVSYATLNFASMKDFLPRHKNGGAFAVALGAVEFLDVPYGNVFKKLDQFKPFELFALVDALNIAQDKREMCLELGKTKQRCDALATKYSTETTTFVDDGSYVVKPFSDEDWKVVFGDEAMKARMAFADRDDKDQFKNARDYSYHIKVNRMDAFNAELPQRG